MTCRGKAGFTLIELMVVIAIIAIVGKLAFVGAGAATHRARDARRLADFDRMVKALRLYRIDNNSYPVETNGDMYVASYNSNFLSELIPNYLPKAPKDPINDQPNPFDWFTKNSHYYGYYYYTSASIAGGTPFSDFYGCGPAFGFAILGVRWLEAGAPRDAPNVYCGPPKPFTCPQWGIPNVCRDWSLEFDYSTMLRD